MRLVRLYRYNYLDNTSLSCDILDGNKRFRDNGCLCLYNRKGDIVEQEYNIGGKKYIATPSITNSVWYNLLRDENGVLKKFVYSGYKGRYIEDAGQVDIGHNVLKPKNGEIQLFRIEIPGLEPQDISIESDDAFFVIKKDENHATKMHYEKATEDDDFPLLETRAIIDEEYSVVYAKKGLDVFFISQNFQEKCIMNLHENIIETLQLEQTPDLNPFLSYKVLNKGIQYDEFNEPIQINGMSTVTKESNPLLRTYGYIAYDRQIEDYKFIGDLRYVDKIVLDPDLEIPIQFTREVYIDCLN